jgi:hypothetical protein
MPTITAPGIGTGFYAPVQPPYIPAPPSLPQQSAPQQTPQSGAQQAENSGRQNTEALAATALTASRLSELSGLMGLPQWGSLFSDTAQGGAPGTGSIDGALKTLLSRLETLEKTLPHQTDTPAVKNEAQIRRFKINGSDILTSCRGVYFSKIDPSGVFLLTGDRKFTYNQQIHDETFYFLFKPKTEQAGVPMYDVAVSVSNAESAVQSYLKLLVNHSPLFAVRTGNFITIRGAENNFDIDLLIDLGG